MNTYTERIPIKLADGTVIQMEVVPLGGEEDVASFDELLPFDDVAGAIESIAQSVLPPLKKVKPKKATVEFGITVGLESGQLTTLLVKGTGDANLKISLEWSSD